MPTDRNNPSDNRKEQQLGGDTVRNQQSQQTGSGNRQQGQNPDQIRRDQQGGGSQSGQQRQEGGMGNQPGSSSPTRSPQQGGNLTEQERNRQQGNRDRER
jgi:hypothetical protein